MELIRKTKTTITKSGNRLYWGIFRCDGCGQEVERRLCAGKVAKSCGCLPKNYKHGERKIKLYSVWISMKNRCYNLKNISYEYYGSRGITICPEWAESYAVFRDWALNNGYQENLTIDRKDPDGNYEPNNCEWLTSKENTRKRKGIKLTLEKANEIRYLHSTGKYTRKQLAKKYKVSRQTIEGIIHNKIWI